MNRKSDTLLKTAVGIIVIAFAIFTVNIIKIWQNRLNVAGRTHISRQALPVELQLINDTRVSRNLGVLVLSEALNKSASDKCRHMVDQNYWGHDGGGRTWRSFITTPDNAGEILARSFAGNFKEKHQSWLDSSTHYGVIVGDYNYFGVANCNYSDGADLTVVHFAK